MSESVSPLRNPRAPDPLRGALPYASRPTDRTLRAVGKLRRIIVSSFVGVAAFCAAVMLAFYAGIGSIFVVLIVGLGGWLWSLKRFTVETTKAGAMMQAQDLAGASSLFRRLAKSRSPFRRAASHYNLALTSARSGDVELALRLWQEAWRSGALFSNAHPIHEALQPLVAIAYAILGDIGAARAWLDDARKRTAVVVNMKHRDVAEIFILARERQWAEAAARLERDWLAIEETFTPELMRSLRIVRALITYHAGDEARGRVLAAATKPLAKGELEWMGRHWPEMQAFIAENHVDA